MWLHDGSSKYVCTYSASQQNFLAVVVGFSNHHDVYIFVQKIDWAYIQKVRYKVGKGGKKPNKDFGTNKLRSAKVFLLLEMKNLKQHWKIYFAFQTFDQMSKNADAYQVKSRFVIILKIAQVDFT